LHTFQDLSQQFEARLRDRSLFSGNPDTLYEPCRYLLGLGGKRVRPVLCLMATELFAPLGEDAWHAAAGIELFHNFTLVHDDIMDRAPLRRGQPTIHARNGLTAGILSGDLLCIAAYQEFASVKHHLNHILQVFNKAAVEVCEGQQLDMDFEQREHTEVDEYIHMITLKTSVLLAASLKIGALIGGATTGNADKLYEFGKNLGIAFQLQDDYLDAFGDPALLGKQAGGDILADKKTYLYLKALELLPDSGRADLLKLLKSETADKKVEKTLDLFRSCGADIKCREATEHYSNLAFDALEHVAAISARKQNLNELASQLLHRKS
jgi:geranylgeranyl diphosphate synthase type II